MRINIYVPEPELRRRVKAEAARLDLTVSEYCLEAIRARLRAHEAEAPPRDLDAAVDRARRFRAEAFAGGTFKVSSAALVRRAREGR